MGYKKQYNGKARDERPRYEDFPIGTLLAGKLRCTYVKLYAKITEAEMQPIFSLNIPNEVIGHATVVETDKATELIAIQLTDTMVETVNAWMKRNNAALIDGIVYIKQNALYWEAVEQPVEQSIVKNKSKLLTYAGLALIARGILK